MIVQHYLGIVGRKHLSPSHVLILLYVRIHIYHLSVSLVPEKETSFSTACIHFEVWTIVRGTNSCLPVVVAQISWFWDQLGLPFKDWPEIFSFQSMSIVNVS